MWQFPANHCGGFVIVPHTALYTKTYDTMSIKWNLRSPLEFGIFLFCVKGSGNGNRCRGREDQGPNEAHCPHSTGCKCHGV